MTIRSSLLSLILSLLLVGCSDDSQKTNPQDAAAPADAAPMDTGPTPDGAAGDVGAPDTLAPADAGLPDGPSGPSVVVQYQGKDHVVVLASATSLMFEGTQHARLSEVVSLALPSLDLSKVGADFVASDGFRAGFGDSECVTEKLIPFPGAKFEKGYIDLVTRKLRWDVALNHPGCMYVKNLATIELADL